MDLLHCGMVVNLLAAIGTIIKFHLRDNIRSAFVFAGNIAHNALDPVAAAGWASFDLKFTAHGHTAFLDEIRK